jgi:hypothetical protein
MLIIALATGSCGHPSQFPDGSAPVDGRRRCFHPLAAASVNHPSEASGPDVATATSVILFGSLRQEQKTNLTEKRWDVLNENIK